MRSPISSKPDLVCGLLEKRSDDPFVCQPINHVLQDIFLWCSQLQAARLQSPSAHFRRSIVGTNPKASQCFLEIGLYMLRTLRRNVIVRQTQRIMLGVSETAKILMKLSNG